MPTRMLKIIKQLFSCLLIMLFAVSCSSLKDTSGQTDLKSKYNGDNTIFKTNRQFTYNVYWMRDKDTLTITTTSEQEIKQMVLTVLPGRFFKQTKVAWQFSNETAFIGNKSITGIIEDENSVWIHPPRSSMPFIFTESTPFPEVKYPLTVGDSWNGTVFIPKGQYDEINLSGKVESHWETKEQIALKTSYKDYDSLWRIASTSQSCIGTGTNDFYFDPIDGFVKMIYTFPNNDRLIFELNSIK